MREFRGVFLTHLKRGILSPMFLICTIICSLMMVFLANDTLAVNYYNLPGLYFFLSQVDNKGSVYLTTMITAFPAAMLFYDDWKSGNFKFQITRVGRRKYTFAVTFSAGITSAGVMILSYVIFSLIVLAKFPAVPSIDAETLRVSTLGFPNSGLLYTGNAFWCYLLFFLTKGAMSAFFAVIAILQSIVFTNKHLTMISPVLVYIIYFSFNLFYILPTVVNPFVLFKNGYKLYLVFGGTQDGSLFSPIAGIYPVIFSTIIAVLLSLIESRMLLRKMNKEL